MLLNISTIGNIIQRKGSSEIDETTVYCPNNRDIQLFMSRWGKKKRQRYAYLVDVKGAALEQAFEAVEYNKGEL